MQTSRGVLISRTLCGRAQPLAMRDKAASNASCTSQPLFMAMSATILADSNQLRQGRRLGYGLHLADFDVLYLVTSVR
ncbi:hypothetical protein PWG14_27775, partial [Chromobacterium amazonense]|uniref:hypothetical protein n=1 Tax=Chromobacterium amazonense TaxID=1382803 RepID=UPI00237D483D